MSSGKAMFHWWSIEPSNRLFRPSSHSRSNQRRYSSPGSLFHFLSDTHLLTSFSKCLSNIAPPERAPAKVGQMGQQPCGKRVRTVAFYAFGNFPILRIFENVRNDVLPASIHAQAQQICPHTIVPPPASQTTKVSPGCLY
jgi:hypothetical protein